MSAINQLAKWLDGDDDDDRDDESVLSASLRTNSLYLSIRSRRHSFASNRQTVQLGPHCISRPSLKLSTKHKSYDERVLVFSITTTTTAASKRYHFLELGSSNSRELTLCEKDSILVLANFLSPAPTSGAHMRRHLAAPEVCGPWESFEGKRWRQQPQQQCPTKPLELVVAADERSSN